MRYADVLDVELLRYLQNRNHIFPPNPPLRPDNPRNVTNRSSIFTQQNPFSLEAAVTTSFWPLTSDGRRNCISDTKKPTLPLQPPIVSPTVVESLSHCFKMG
jgi:hypothetical protein